MAAIQEAEKNTSGEIRVHIEAHTDEDHYEHALKVFAELKMHKTELRNGVLFYVAVNDHKFVILGDQGINDKVTDFMNVDFPPAFGPVMTIFRGSPRLILFVTTLSLLINGCHKSWH